MDSFFDCTKSWLDIKGKGWKSTKNYAFNNTAPLEGQIKGAFHEHNLSCWKK